MSCLFVFEDDSINSTTSLPLVDETPYEKLKNVASGRSCVLKDVPGDGNCLYHAVLDQLQDKQTSHAPQDYLKDILKLRSDAIAYLEEHLTLINESFLVCSEYKDGDSYLEKQRHNEPIIGAMAGLLDVNIGLTMVILLK